MTRILCSTERRKRRDLYAIALVVWSSVALTIAVPSFAMNITLDFGTGSPDPSDVQGGFYKFASRNSSPYVSSFYWYNVVAQHFDGRYVQGHYDTGHCGEFSACLPLSEESPYFGMDIDYDGSTYLGTDATLCRQVDKYGKPIGPVTEEGYPIGEDNHISECGTNLRIERGGRPFDVHSFVNMGAGIRSSKGGVEYGDFLKATALEGDLWEGVFWIDIELCACGYPAGIDDLVVSTVPEGPHIALLGALAIAGLVVSRPRRRFQ